MDPQISKLYDCSCKSCLSTSTRDKHCVLKRDTLAAKMIVTKRHKPTKKKANYLNRCKKKNLQRHITTKKTTQNSQRYTKLLPQRNAKWTKSNTNLGYYKCKLAKQNKTTKNKCKTTTKKHVY